MWRIKDMDRGTHDQREVRSEIHAAWDKALGCQISLQPLPVRSVRSGDDTLCDRLKIRAKYPSLYRISTVRAAPITLESARTHRHGLRRDRTPYDGERYKAGDGKEI